MSHARTPGALLTASAALPIARLNARTALGAVPGAVFEPVDKKYDGVIGRWVQNGISALDAEKERLVSGTPLLARCARGS